LGQDRNNPVLLGQVRTWIWESYLNPLDVENLSYW
jgi:hypothetical protein